MCLTQDEINTFRAINSELIKKDLITTIFIKEEFDSIVVDTQSLGIEVEKLNYYKSLFKKQNGRILVIIPRILLSWKY